ncbi:MAG TPA: sialidase family protein [Thermoanaerobaculia bacterium]|nr:sialidase family protein [Thermoanaerobaculia bacterium]
MSKRFLLSACAALAACVLTAGAAAAGTARAGWPSLQTQLAQDRVPAGSPLAKLIADNQDFQLLRPEEANDKVAVPPWLRVLWHKEHPDMQYVPGDGSGGYPLVLKEVHEWMVYHPDLQPGSLGREMAEKKKPRGGGPKPVPGPDFSISGAQPTPRSESDIRVNFWDPSRIVSSSNNLHAAGTLAMFYSSDGGATWKQTVMPRDPSESFQSDPAVDWTSDGTAWATTISIYSSSPPLRLYLHAYKSTDGGASWKMDSTISGADQSQADKQMMWVDHSEQSPYKDNIYVIWHDGLAVFVSHHTPGGGWSEPLQISGGETKGTGIGGDIKTDALGRVYAFWPDTGSRKIYFAKSTDGGQSFSRPAVVSPTFQSFDTGLPAQASRGALLYVTSGVWISGKNVNVYAAWTDLSGAKGCSTPVDDPRSDVNSPCKTRIWFAKSTNGGTKWTRAKAIYNPAGKNDQFNPWLAVDESSGLLGIMYYDSVGGPRTSVNVFFQSSANGGNTWSSPARVSSAPSDDEDFNDPNQFGDYNALSAAAGTFFPSWTDRRDPTGKEEIWTAPITIQAKSCEGLDSTGSRGLKIFIEGIEDLFANSCAP